MVKGIQQNVIPYSDGWAVFEDWQPNMLRIFNAKEEAIAYAHRRSHTSETPVLLHSSFPSETERLTLLIMSGDVAETALEC